jgi:CRISPR-associated protein Cas2
MSEAKRHENDTMLYLVSYDIPDDRRRTRVHSALTGYGTWVQYSVFECFLDKKQLMKLEARLHKEIHHKEDAIRIYGLCASCYSKVEILGSGEPPKEEYVYLL